MVLSENNEPFMKSTPLVDDPNPDNGETLSSPLPVYNPSERLRSIEMASNSTNRKKIDLKFLKIIKKVKIRIEKLLPAYHNISSTISIFFNFFLLVVIIVLSQQVFALKKIVVGEVLGGLYMNIGEMDKASISTEFNVMDNILLDFPLQINQETEVILTADTVIQEAYVSLFTDSLSITNARATIVLPKGTILPIQVDMIAPVDATVPLNLNVPVNIPLEKTELHQQFADMQNVIQPHLISFMDESFYNLEVPACKGFGFICDWWFR